MSDNLKIWNDLGKTDPKHTKAFSRSGGFKGTAIKPIYTEQKMTETFGPCGIGWGFSEPTFQLVNGPEGEVAVYCWLSLWVTMAGERSAPIPGVGGDFVVKKNKYGLSTDDEAFKKAFTDAVGNAMKHLGMSADVHMGLFDDSKYVSERREEEASTAAPKKISERAQAVVQAPPTAPTLSALADDMIARLEGVTGTVSLRTLGTSSEWAADLAKLSGAEADAVRTAYGKAQRDFRQIELANTP